MPSKIKTVIINAAKAGYNLVEFVFEFEYLFGGYLYVGSLSLYASHRLVNHHAAVG